MIFSGYNYISIPEVEALNFYVPMSIDAINGSGSFGFSGSGNNGETEIIEFEFQDGRIKDFNGNYVHSYFPNRNIDISGHIFPGGHIYYIDDHPVSLSGTQDYFKFKRFFYNSKDVNIDSVASLGIEQPTITFNNPSYFDISGTYTGEFIKNIEFQVFSGTILGANQEMFTLSDQDFNPGNKTGSFVMSLSESTKLYNDLDYLVSLNLDTDFGTVAEPISFRGFTPSRGREENSQLTKTHNSIDNYRNYDPLTMRTNSYTLIYSLTQYGVEQPKPIGVELSYYAGDTGAISGYRGDIDIKSSGSGFFTGDSLLYVTGGGGSGFVSEIQSDWTYPSPGPNRGTGNIQGITVINYGQNYVGPDEVLSDISGNQGSGSPLVTPVLFEYTKSLFETWDLQTGYTKATMSSYSGNNYKNETYPNAIYTDSYYGEGFALTEKDVTRLYIDVNWIPLYDTAPVTAKLRVTGEGFDFVEYITGIK